MATEQQKQGSIATATTSSSCGCTTTTTASARANICNSKSSTTTTTTTTTTTPPPQTSNGMTNVIIRQDRGCVTIASLDKDIRDAQRRVDAGNVTAIGSLQFRKSRKDLFLSGAMDSKLIAQGCPPLGGTAKTDPVTEQSAGSSGCVGGNCGANCVGGNCNPSSSRGCVGGRCGKSSTSRGCSAQQRRTGTCGQRKSSSVQTAGFDMGGGGNRGLLVAGILLAVGATGFWAYRTGKLDGVIAKAKGFGSKLRKK